MKKIIIAASIAILGLAAQAQTAAAKPTTAPAPAATTSTLHKSIPVRPMRRIPSQSSSGTISNTAPVKTQRAAQATPLVKMEKAAQATPNNSK